MCAHQERHTRLDPSLAAPSSDLLSSQVTLLHRGGGQESHKEHLVWSDTCLPLSLGCATHELCDLWQITDPLSAWISLSVKLKCDISKYRNLRYKGPSKR